MADKYIQLQSADGTDNLFPVGKMDLLWTNTSPTSSFAGQTVELNLSGYKMLYIELRLTTSNNAKLSMMFMVGSGDIKVYIHNARQNRQAYTSSEGVVFTNCFSASQSGTMATDNTCLIPLAIYGIK